MAKRKVKKRMGQPPKGANALRTNIVTRVKVPDKMRLDREARAQDNKKPSALARELILDGLAKLEKKRKGRNT